MRLGKNDKVATDPGAPFGAGMSSFGGGQPGSGTPGEANPNRSGPPPAAAGASHVIACHECGKICNDGGELDEHMRTEHLVRHPLATKQDITVPAALIFIDSLGDTIPFKRSFTFKELSDFCHREGINLLASKPLDETELLVIAENIAAMTQNHVQIEARPTKTAARAPLSSIDLNVAGQSAKKACRECDTPIAANRLFCNPCQKQRYAAIEGPIPQADKSIHLYAHVTLHDGAALHVVEVSEAGFIGVDDLFQARHFTAREAATVHNMEEDLRSVEAARCDTCGEENFAFSTKCATCGASNGAS